MKISVIGAGYVGLTTAACLAQIGHHVFCGESDFEKLANAMGSSSAAHLKPGIPNAAR